MAALRRHLQGPHIRSAGTRDTLLLVLRQGSLENAGVLPAARVAAPGVCPRRSSPRQASPRQASPRTWVGQMWVKDESNRLGLPAYKILGAAYRALDERYGPFAPWETLPELTAKL